MTRGGEYIVKEDGLQYRHDPSAAGPSSPEDYLIRFRCVVMLGSDDLGVVFLEKC